MKAFDHVPGLKQKAERLARQLPYLDKVYKSGAPAEFSWFLDRIRKTALAHKAAERRARRELSEIGKPKVNKAGRPLRFVYRPREPEEDTEWFDGNETAFAVEALLPQEQREEGSVNGQQEKEKDSPG
jgi:hypothetical protein